MSSRRCRGEDGSVMPMATILVAFLMVAGWAFVSAAQQWTARRGAYAAAAAAARAGAQADPALLRSGIIVDPQAATFRANELLALAGFRGEVTVDGSAVTVRVTAPVGYSFPAPGFPARVSGIATAVARRGVTGIEPGA